MIWKRLEDHGINTYIVTENAEGRCNIAFQFIHEYLGPRKTLALQEFHSITGRAQKGESEELEKSVSSCLWGHLTSLLNPK